MRRISQTRLLKMKQSIFTEDRKYTFSDYFTMSASTEQIVTELGYSFAMKGFSLPKKLDYDPQIVTRLNALYYSVLPNINLNSEVAKREFLIAPLLMELSRYAGVRINVEYAIFINDKLAGNFDYLLQSEHKLIVIEAKNKDMECGFNQLAAQLIALDYHEQATKTPLLYGAITLGDVWKFAILDRDKKQLIKDINIYTVPHHTDEVFAVLIGILMG